jgi:hypothetical protein
MKGNGYNCTIESSLDGEGAIKIHDLKMQVHNRKDI